MVQSILTFALGFLAAAFLAFAVAPAIWQRAVSLTRKRLESSMPLTLNEVLADKDQQRAEFAMSIRKVEMKAKALQDKVTAQMVDVATNQERSRQFMAERDSLNEKANGLDSNLAASKQEVVERDSSIASLQALIAEYEQKLDLYAAEVDAQERALVELQIDADNKRIELATRATEREDLVGRIGELSKIRVGLEENLRAASGEAKETREVVRAAVRKASDLEKRSEKLVTQLNDREERLARREAELMRLKESVRLLQSEKSVAEQLVQSTERQRQTLAVQNVKLIERTEKLASMAMAGGADKTMKKLQDDKTRLISMVEQLTGEKNELVVRLKAATGSANQDAALREQVHDLTARIVSVATDAEGPRSPVTKLLNTANESEAKVQNAEPGEQESLADRIRALQKAASRSA